jgi:hypothetical protein
MASSRFKHVLAKHLARAHCYMARFQQSATSHLEASALAGCDSAGWKRESTGRGAAARVFGTDLGRAGGVRGLARAAASPGPTSRRLARA